MCICNPELRTPNCGKNCNPNWNGKPQDKTWIPPIESSNPLVNQPPKISKFIHALRFHFEKELSTKTGWGRVEALAAMERSVGAALVDLIE